MADDHHVLVEPACGAALAAVYSGVLERLRREERLPVLRSAVLVVCGGSAIDLATLQRLQKEVTDDSAVGGGVDEARHSVAALQSRSLQEEEDDDDDLLLMPTLNAVSCFLETSSDEDEKIIET